MPEIKVEVYVRRGEVSTTNEKVRALQHWQIPPRTYLREGKQLHVDFGRNVHTRAHAGYLLEAQATLRGNVTSSAQQQ